MQRLFKKKIIEYEFIMELVCLIDGPINRTIRRLHYKVLLEDYSTRYCMTTNEFDESFNVRKPGEDFVIYHSLEHLVSGFDRAIDFEVFKRAVNSYKIIPNFIHYNVIYIKKSVYLVFYSELKNTMESISDAQLSAYERQRVNYWLEL